MIKICQIPECPRTGSTFLNSYISLHGDCINLNEFFSLIVHSLPRKKVGKSWKFIWDIDGNNLYELFKKKEFKKANTLVLDNWKENWFYKSPKIIENKFCFVESYKPYIMNPIYEKQIMQNCLDIILNLKQSFVLKIFPGNILSVNKILGIDLIEILKENDIQFITSVRKNIMDICISMAYANYSKIFNLYNDNINEKKVIENKFDADLNSIKTIFKEKTTFRKLYKLLPDNTIPFIYEFMVSDPTMILKKLGIDFLNDVSTDSLPRKLYSDMPQLQKISFINNFYDFYKYVDKELERYTNA